MAGYPSLNRLSPVLICVFIGRFSAAALAQQTPQLVRPDAYLTRYCAECHSGEKPEADLDVRAGLGIDFTDRRTRERWAEVVNALNSHSMPPEDSPQPTADETAQVVDWATLQLVDAERRLRENQIVLRRMNRTEYRNALRELTGVDIDVAAFPQEASAGGFDNNGAALTLSPLHLELFYETAQRVLQRALVEGDRPPTVRWRFEPETGDNDSNRVDYAGQRAIVNGGNNPVRDGFKVIHHANWDKTLNARDFRLPCEGEYIIRIRAGGIIPNRQQVVESARSALQSRYDREHAEHPERERWQKEAFERDLQHFRTDRMYDYGPPRAKLTRDLGGQPTVLDEFDVTGTPTDPSVHELRARFSTDKAGLTVEYAYSVPRELENFWFQTSDDFARPELWVDWFEIEGPVYDAWPPSSHTRILFESTLSSTDQHRYAEEVIRRFMRRAWRRPVTPEELAIRVAICDEVRSQSGSLLDGIRTSLVSVLISPHFLYLAEPSADSSTTSHPEPRLLTEFELASRLAGFLWSSIPDDELLAAAEHGHLHDPRFLDNQIDRMLEDKRSDELVRNFAGQWLGLRDVGANPPAEDLFPRYDRHLEESIVAESEEFFAYVLRNDLDVMNFVKSDFVVINERLGRYYGIPGVRGDDFRPVAVPDGVARGGIFTQASMLTITSNGTRTSPVKRGTWILKNVLGTDPGLPVANVGEIAPGVPGIDRATVRQRLEIHRQLPQCARCHNRIDPLGFALENFNAAGEYREREGFGYKGRINADDPVIDASARLPDGTEVLGVRGLQDVLLQKEDLFLHCLADRLLTYALGRQLTVTDAPQLTAAVAHLKQNDRTLRSLIHFIVQSDTFRQK